MTINPNAAPRRRDEKSEYLLNNCPVCFYSHQAGKIFRVVWRLFA
jgi:hypothetical protein